MDLDVNKLHDLTQLSDEELLLLRRIIQVLFIEEGIYKKDLWERVVRELKRRE